MRVFLMVAALLIGLVNSTLYDLFGNSPLGGPVELRPDPWPLLMMHALYAILVGLMVSGAILLFLERNLRGTFRARYGLMVLAIVAGGVILNVLLNIATTVFDNREPMPGRVSEVFYALAFTIIPGGILGAVEGVILAFPLAAVLGLFRERSGRGGAPAAQV